MCDAISDKVHTYEKYRISRLGQYQPQNMWLPEINLEFDLSLGFCWGIETPLVKMLLYNSYFNVVLDDGHPSCMREASSGQDHDWILFAQSLTLSRSLGIIQVRTFPFYPICLTDAEDPDNTSLSNFPSYQIQTKAAGVQ